MVEEDEIDFRILKEVGGRKVVLAERKDFKKAIKRGLIPLDVNEATVLSEAGMKLDEDSVVLLVKSSCPLAKLERVKWHSSADK